MKNPSLRQCSPYDNSIHLPPKDRDNYGLRYLRDRKTVSLWTHRTKPAGMGSAVVRGRRIAPNGKRSSAPRAVPIGFSSGVRSPGRRASRTQDTPINAVCNSPDSVWCCLRRETTDAVRTLSVARGCARRGRYIRRNCMTWMDNFTQATVIMSLGMGLVFLFVASLVVLIQGFCTTRSKNNFCW